KQDPVRFSAAAIVSLQQHDWPGNVRELANLVERLSIISPNADIGLDDLPPQYRYDISAAEERPSVGQGPEEAVVRRMPLASHQKAVGATGQDKRPAAAAASQRPAQADDGRQASAQSPGGSIRDVSRNPSQQQ